MVNKIFSKRTLAWILALVMCFSSVQLQALASGSNQLLDGFYTLDNTGAVTGTVDKSANSANGFTVKKTATQTGENAFDITLEVQTSQTVTTNAAAIQLVIDRSNSMAYCAACGSQYFCRCNAGNRMSAVKDAIAGTNGFLDSLVANNPGAIYVSVVTFGSYASTVKDWTDITTAEGLAAVKSAVNGISIDGGTNLEAGLMLARNRLSMKDIASCGSKYTVLLTDGAPTYYVSGNYSSTSSITDCQGSGSSPSSNTINGAVEMATAVKALSKLYTICYGVSDDDLYETESTSCSHCSQTKEQHVELCTRCHKAYSEHTPGRWVTNCPDSKERYQRGYYCDATAQNRFTVTNTTVTVGGFLSGSISSGSGYSYTADDTAEVNSAFANIASSAVSGMTGAGTSVTDPMGQFIVLGNISGIQGVSKNGNGLVWNLDQNTLVDTQTSGNTTTYTYRITYPITLNTAAEGFQETHPDGSTKYYPTNGYTYLSVGSTQIPFNVPGVCGKIPQLNYQVKYFLQDGATAGDYSRYTLADMDNFGPVKAWTNVEAPSGYINKYAQQHYRFAYGTPTLQVTPGGTNVIHLYYDRITAGVTVNHFYKTDVLHASGSTAMGTYPGTPNRVDSATANAGQQYTAALHTTFDGNTYTLDTATPNVTITVSETLPNVINLYYTRTVNTYAYGVTYNGNGGVLSTDAVEYSDSENITDTYATSHSVHVDANTFSREHYDFTGWNTKADGTGTAYSAEDVISLTPADNTRTLYAQWKIHPKYDYTVTYNANFGTNPKTAADTQNAVQIFATSHTIDVDANMFDRLNYTFAGWATSPEGEIVYQPEDAITFTNGGSAVLYAKWIMNDQYSYTVSYNGNGGITASNEVAYPDAENVDVTFATSHSVHVDGNRFVREHYDFIGWNTKADGTGTAYSAEDVISLTPADNTRTLYAQWKIHPKYDYAVTYNANFGTDPETKADAENQQQIFATSHSIHVDTNTFSRPHYTFISWNTKADGTGTAYSAEDVISLTPTDNTRTLYAQWSLNDYEYVVEYLVRVDDGAYTPFTGILPESAPLGGSAAYGTTIHDLVVPEVLTDSQYTYDFTSIDTITVGEEDNVIHVYYTYITELVDIPEEDVPLVDIPDEDVPLVDIPDEDVPLAEVPKTGDATFLYATLTAISGFGLAALGLKKKKEENNEA